MQLPTAHDSQDGQLDHNIERMRYAATDLLIKLSRLFGRRRQGVIFLVINFNHILWVSPGSPLSCVAEQTASWHHVLSQMLHVSLA